MTSKMLIAICLLSIFIITYVHSFLMDVSDDKYIFHRVKEISDKIYYVPEAWLYHYIDADRLSFENFKKLFLKTGNEEKIRSRSEGGGFAVFKKGIEFIVKFSASLLIYGIFILKGEERWQLEKIIRDEPYEKVNFDATVMGNLYMDMLIHTGKEDTYIQRI